MDDGELKAHARRWEAIMSKLAWAEMAGAVPEHGDAYLARGSTWGEQQRWQLPALLLPPSAASGEVSITVLWYRTGHFGPGKLGHDGLPPPSMRLELAVVHDPGLALTARWANTA